MASLSRQVKEPSLLHPSADELAKKGGAPDTVQLVDEFCNLI